MTVVKIKNLDRNQFFPKAPSSSSSSAHPVILSQSPAQQQKTADKTLSNYLDELITYAQVHDEENYSAALGRLLEDNKVAVAEDVLDLLLECQSGDQENLAELKKFRGSLNIKNKQ